MFSFVVSQYRACGGVFKTWYLLTVFSHFENYQNDNGLWFKDGFWGFPGAKRPLLLQQKIPRARVYEALSFNFWRFYGVSDQICSSSRDVFWLLHRASFDLVALFFPLSPFPLF